jgi:hypothetical protein
VVGTVVVAVLAIVFDWLFHIDGFRLAATAESRVVERINRWLASFDQEP